MTRTEVDQTQFTSRKPQTSASPPRMLPMLISLALIFFVMGSAVSEFRFFPYSELLQPSFTAARALHRRMALTASLKDTDLWHPSRFEKRGVLRNEPGKTCSGYTLYTSGHASAAYLIDMDGRVVHQWQLPFHQLWPAPSHVERPVPEPFIYWRRAYLFPNGDLIAMYEAAGDTPWGYGLVKVDRESKVIWSVADHIHHDLYVKPDGSIITLAHAWRDSHANPVSSAPQLGCVLLDDFVVVISPEGQVVERISLLSAIASSDYADLLTTVPEDEWDLLHTNTVELISPEFASHHDFAQAGQVLVSFRSRNALAILDLASKKIVWASCGPYRAQHDPDVLPNGHVLLFDNRGHVGPGGPSRVLEYDPATQAIAWMYTGTAEEPLFSLVRSTQQVLANGNILITESDAGRILEVSRAGEICWEFCNPARLPDDAASIAIVCGATRIPYEQVCFPCETPQLNTLVVKD